MMSKTHVDFIYWFITFIYTHKLYNKTLFNYSKCFI